MKKINLPEIFLKLFCFMVFISLLIEAIFQGGFSIFFFYTLIAPIIIVLLIIWKLYNRGIKNKFFIPILFINILSILFMIYTFMHMFDNMLM